VSLTLDQHLDRAERLVLEADDAHEAIQRCKPHTPEHRAAVDKFNNLRRAAGSAAVVYIRELRGLQHQTPRVNR
jgi:hypothetical protein